MNLPSTAFDLDVAAVPSTDVSGRMWALTGFVPALAPIDWYGVPDHTLDMRVTATRKGRARELFGGRVAHFVLMTSRPVGVEHGEKFPYAALLPAEGATTRFHSDPASRADYGGTMHVGSSAPKRPVVNDWDSIETESDYEKRPDLSRRGPIVDVLGPSVSFVVKRRSHAELFAGFDRVRGIRPGDRMRVSIRTPFALRLVAHPATRTWSHDLGNYWSDVLARAKKKEPDAIAQRKAGPRMQGRYVNDDALPVFSVRLRNVAVPEPAVWRRFARRSASDGAVPPLLRPLDPANDFSIIYQLPPVDPVVQVGVFGPVAEYVSSAVRGEIVAGSTTRRIVFGEALRLESDQGLAAGRYAMTPLVSAGTGTGTARVAGKARVEVAGAAVTRMPILPWLLGAVAVTLLALGIEATVKWLSAEP